MSPETTAEMIAISLLKFRKKMTKEGAATTDKAFSQLQKQGVKVLGFYFTLGRYDAVLITEEPDSGATERVMKTAMAASDYVATETLVALKRKDALKLLD
jgi:uncharacterized protein with GYD domain